MKGASNMKYSRDLIKGILSNNKRVLVNFTKKNGKTRDMLCTIHPDLLPPTPDGAEPDHTKPPRADIDINALVFDLEKKGWRKFSYDKVNRIEIV
jgi:hypothetical protein